MILFAETDLAVGYKERTASGVFVTIETVDSRTITLVAPATATDAICDELFVTGIEQLFSPSKMTATIPVA
ncbi:MULTISPECIES: hypothetical protein [Exiguobacterium]|uniref:Uncharacterized protein n=1 Tax=Exiguobacterium sibiricum (strain DSM 17290 / CCUG 55495 / CIP 109462 / JCM 13490 / 255-15) TaxID=262543 RepID=B1YJ96_EXIS2|nr:MULTISPECIES: hypothetical protein [Exiguobacterium]ACB61477.1 hypothetical protein Exig_2025 [Exiguobacterium sibiricum 255-15]MCT4793110.1 hypothetical protein [Exiguobacterium artemiae]MDW2883971.1 hypothetical protein [Exiguobacterium sibiricum]MDX1258439.1 hypothetical protein [Exiguobacterium sp. K1]HCN56919.1 hypothetical protein [Exiguobacterium sp.]